MNILGIDYGKKRIGLAWCDPAIGVVLPYGVVEQSAISNQLSALADLITKEKIDEIVVGMPHGLDSAENENTRQVREFIEKLKAVSRKPIAMVDERFTSAEADRMGGDATRDEKAAMLLLQAYLERLQ